MGSWTSLIPKFLAERPAKRPKRDGKTEESIRIYRNKNLPRVPEGSSNSSRAIAAYLVLDFQLVSNRHCQVTQAELNEFVLREYADSR